ncbi:MAG: hypothetical protein RL563_1369 [Pseudomonadota bacterium]
MPIRLNLPISSALLRLWSQGKQMIPSCRSKLIPSRFLSSKLFKISLLGLSALLLCIVVLLFFAIDDSPLLEIHRGFNREDIQRAKQLLHIAPEDRDKVKTLNLNQNDINIATSYLLDHFVENTVQIRITGHTMFVQVAIFVPRSFWGRYLDFSFKLIQNTEVIKIKSLKIGEISIPDTPANYLLRYLIDGPVLGRYGQLAKQYIQHIHITPGNVEISYLGAMVDAAKQLVIQKHRDYPNLHLYQQQINAIVTSHDPAWRLSLMDLLQPLFASAFQRSDEETAIQENRAVIIAVASYIYKHDLRRYLPVGLVYSKEYEVFAYKRVDIPQHFIASALLAAVDSSLLAEKMGIDKEFSDANGGSGFSFIDLTADRAGKKFGEFAIASGNQARKLQAFMATSKDYASIIPNALDLPEHLDEVSFKARYQQVDSQEYAAQLQEIERRIRDLPIYQAVNRNR